MRMMEPQRKERLAFLEDRAVLIDEELPRSHRHDLERNGHLCRFPGGLDGSDGRRAQEVVGRELPQALGDHAQKKSFVAAERDEAARASYRTEVKNKFTKQLVFIDETSAYVGQSREYGWATSVKRVCDTRPKGKKARVSLIAAPADLPAGATLLPGMTLTAEIHTGTRTVLEAAEAVGVQRVVHVSSVATWGYDFVQDLTEEENATLEARIEELLEEIDSEDEEEEE